jgi:hypothetical protein
MIKLFIFEMTSYGLVEVNGCGGNDDAYKMTI